jgi:hypothetical protein
MQGIFSPDREPHPAVEEIKYLQQPIFFKAVFLKGRKVAYIDENRSIQIVIENRFVFRPLTELQWTWSITSEAPSPSKLNPKLKKVPEAGILIICPELTTAKMYDTSGKHWLHIQIYFKGYEIARERFELIHKISRQRKIQIPKSPGNYFAGQSSLEVKQNDITVEIWLKGLNLRMATVEKSSGTLSSYTTPCGNEVISLGQGGLIPNYTRASVDNDRGGVDRLGELLPTWVYYFDLLTGSFKYSYSYLWNKLGLDPLSPPRLECENIQVVQKENCGSIQVLTSGRVVSRCFNRKKYLFSQQIGYNFFQDGSIHVSNRILPLTSALSVTTLPRFGFFATINRSLYNISYLGRGPNENYCDRKSSAAEGIWCTSPSKMGYNYIVPSENGNRCDCTWISFRNDNGVGLLLVKGDDSEKSGLNFSALLHDQKEFHAATHTSQLERRVEGQHPIYMNVDSKLMGIGGDVGYVDLYVLVILLPLLPFSFHLK